MANSVQQSQPNLASLLELFKGNLMMQLNCHQVGEIVSFDPSTQTAEVQIKMMKTQNGELKDYAILLDCPCIVLSGGKGRLTLPITAGDSCLVLFNDRDIDNWFAGGQKMQPRTERMHNYSDAIALVGLRNLQNKITDYLADGTELKYGGSTMKLQDDKVTVTNGTSTVVMDSRTLTVTAPIINVIGNVNVVQDTVDDNSLHAYIISSYHSGTEWYRVWSDGWCEQGGSITTSEGTIVFQKEFIDTNYTFISQASDFDDYAIVVSTWGNKTKSSIQVRCGYNGVAYSREISWEAKGYIK